MFGRFSNSWQLVKASWSVLQSDKELILFPIVSFLGVIVVTATFAVPMLLAGFFDSLTQGTGSGIMAAIIGFIFYLVMYTVIIFSNAALIGAASIRLQGGDPTLGDGFRSAWQHIGSIIGYAAISATVGMILRAISERGGLVGSIVSSIVGFAWNVVTFLVVPVLVIEGIGPVEAVQRSGSLLKRTWGEQLVGNFSIGMIFGLLTFAVILLGVPVIIVFASSGSVLLIIAGVGLVVLAVMAINLIGSTLGGIYQAAVYQYAVNGTTSGFFDDALVQGAFRRK